MQIHWLERKFQDEVELNEAVEHAGGLVMFETFERGEAHEREVGVERDDTMVTFRREYRLGATVEFAGYVRNVFTVRGYWQLTGDFVAAVHIPDGEQMGQMHTFAGIGNSMGDIVLRLEEFAQKQL